ncbi:radical SAM protein [Streptomyces sp. NBC_01477]|uniref:radical SAM protein n=1 Tax=Streptomyces sp. NBC_01477 TaxID=2976015 RepID=UPI002E303FE7|nr:radical SAM protein [Streptomyces sp. NBC_01477]
MDRLLNIWYVSSQRLCNFRCTYCVSTGDYAKSDTSDWKHERDRDDVGTVVRWMAAQPYPVGVRLATLGEPFASRDFLTQAAWLTQQPRVRFVELLTNGSLLKRRLPVLAETADLSRLTLWITHHHTEIPTARFIENALFARDTYGCFVVVNALLFPDNAEQVSELRRAAHDAGLRFNLDLGYTPGTPNGEFERTEQMAPLLGTGTSAGMAGALSHGANRELLELNVTALGPIKGLPCQAGHDYLYIGINGDVYPCSRYYVLQQDRIGNALDPDFRLELRDDRWAGCKADSGCCNKEDFLNLRARSREERSAVPSLGWLD